MKHDIVTERNQVCQEETEVKPDSIKEQVFREALLDLQVETLTFYLD